MEINLEFKKAVKNCDIDLIRIMLKDSIIMDPTFVMYKNLVKYVEQNGLNLFEEYDGAGFADKCYWNKDYLNQQMAQLICNFSKERVKHIKDICKNVYKTEFFREERKAFSSNDKIPNKKSCINNNYAKLYKILKILREILFHFFKSNRVIENKSAERKSEFDVKREIKKDINKIKEHINEEIRKNNEWEVKRLLIKSLERDDSLKIFDELIKFAEERINLYQEYNGDKDVEDIKYDIGMIVNENELEEKYKKYIESLWDNFARERIDILRKISKQLQRCRS